MAKEWPLTGYAASAYAEAIRDLEQQLAAERERRERMEAALRSVEWSGGDPMMSDSPICPCCEWSRGPGHAPDCQIGMALADAPAPPQPSAREQQLEAALRAVEWSGRTLTADDWVAACQECERRPEQGHAADCVVGLALVGAPALAHPDTARLDWALQHGLAVGGAFGVADTWIETGCDSRDDIDALMALEPESPPDSPRDHAEAQCP